MRGLMVGLALVGLVAAGWLAGQRRTWAMAAEPSQPGLVCKACGRWFPEGMDTHVCFPRSAHRALVVRLHES